MTPKMHAEADRCAESTLRADRTGARHASIARARVRVLHLTAGNLYGGIERPAGDAGPVPPPRPGDGAGVRPVLPRPAVGRTDRGRGRRSTTSGRCGSAGRGRCCGRGRGCGGCWRTRRLGRGRRPRVLAARRVRPGRPSGRGPAGPPGPRRPGRPSLDRAVGRPHPAGRGRRQQPLHGRRRSRPSSRACGRGGLPAPSPRPRPATRRRSGPRSGRSSAPRPTRS